MTETVAAGGAQKQRRSTKAKAILAGGLVLGVGAAITLAAWTDQEWARGIFSSGEFGIEGSVDGGANYADHPNAASAAQLDFQVDADTLSPGDTVYAGFAVRLTENSTNQAEVAVTQDDSAKIAGTTASYRYTTSATCDATAYGAGTNENGASFDLTVLNAPVYVCFRVSADDTLPQGETGTILWNFTATSTEAL